MNRIQQIQYLIQVLLKEMPAYQEQARAFPQDELSQRRLLRSLMNVRPPMPLDPSFLAVQDALLSAEREEKGVVEADALPDRPGHPGIAVWQGDITRLKADAIVDADNDRLLGCFVPCHGCIDNAIHTYAGVQLRLECSGLMKRQGHKEEPGRAKITKAYNLPCRYVLHTIGPVIGDAVAVSDRRLLADCYRSCLDLAAKHGLHSVVFCCISTGEFRFPNELAAQVAIQTVIQWQRENPNQIEVIFNVFKERDYDIYEKLLRAD